MEVLDGEFNKNKNKKKKKATFVKNIVLQPNSFQSLPGLKDPGSTSGPRYGPQGPTLTRHEPRVHENGNLVAGRLACLSFLFVISSSVLQKGLVAFQKRLFPVLALPRQHAGTQSGEKKNKKNKQEATVR